ncbi:MAG: ATP-binding protein [Sphaerochaetaceae bacterium]
MKGVCFVAGVYGVGKSTLCNRVSSVTHIPYYSAGDLISQKNGEQYGKNKKVKDAVNNQQLLAEAVAFLLEKNDRLLLAGHFCILSQENTVERLPVFVYRELSIKQIVLLELDAGMIVMNLRKRDGKDYPESLMKTFLGEERGIAKSVASDLSVPLDIIKLNYSDDLQRMIKLVH